MTVSKNQHGGEQGLSKGDNWFIELNHKINRFLVQKSLLTAQVWRLNREIICLVLFGPAPCQRVVSGVIRESRQQEIKMKCTWSFWKKLNAECRNIKLWLIFFGKEVPWFYWCWGSWAKNSGAAACYSLRNSTVSCNFSHRWILEH